MPFGNQKHATSLEDLSFLSELAITMAIHEVPRKGRKSLETA